MAFVFVSPDDASVDRDMVGDKRVRDNSFLQSKVFRRMTCIDGGNTRFVTYRHGFRVSELVALSWNQFELDNGRMHVSRSKDGSPSVHPIRGPEIRVLRRLKREYPDSPYVFVTERKGPLTDSAVRKMVARAGDKAGFDFPVHPHMLRHATGYKLANDGHDTRAIQQYLGHKNIQHTVRYTELASTRFRDFWKD
jgi:type 1 fimbriae regulatory protein FimB/type 1 fimbriae regulatory protein FimE